MQEFWRHMVSPQVHKGCDPSMPKIQQELQGVSPLSTSLKPPPPAPALCDSPIPIPLSIPF